MKRKGAKPNCVQAFVVAHKNKSKELHVERHSDETACKNRTDKEAKEIPLVDK